MNAALLVILLVAPAHTGTRGYSVTDFDRIRVEGPYTVTLATGHGRGRDMDVLAPEHHAGRHGQPFTFEAVRDQDLRRDPEVVAVESG